LNKDQTLGWAVLLGSITGVVLYYYLVFMSAWALLTIQVSAFLALGSVLVIVAWIGYTLATTPPPEPLEDFSFDEELSEDEEEGESEAEDEKR
jgi:predicted DNA-binding transcriptional regulator